MPRFATALALLCLFTLVVFPTRHHAQSQDAPGRPGATSTWTSGHKTGLGTSVNQRSKVWYTLGNGNLTEVYYPRLDVPNLRALDFIVTDGRGYRRLESLHATRRETTWNNPSALSFTQTTGEPGRWELVKSYTTDPNRNTLLVNLSFRSLDRKPYQVYVLSDPSIGNSGMHDTGNSDGNWLIAQDGNIAMATVARPAFARTGNGFAGTSDAWTDFEDNGRLDWMSGRAADGNIVQAGQLAAPANALTVAATLAFGFGDNPAAALDAANGSLKDGFAAVKKAHDDEWAQFVKRLPTVEPTYRDAFTMAAMTLLAHEDKTYRGASVASVSIPWGEIANADEPTYGGYHLVWSRDLYHVATAWLALGDRDAAGRALDYLFNTQQREDGSFPQNTWMDGRPYWSSLQLDEVAYPIVLAWQLERFDETTYRKHVRPAAEFILKKGPETPQERWEEEEGYSPSTIAAEIAGLVCAADIATRLNRPDDANRYRKTAREWADGVEQWCYTTTGPLDAGESERGYYIRINNNKNPNDGFKLEVNNGGGERDERSVVDAGFLELVRLGIRPATDPRVRRSLKTIDRTIKVETPYGPGWYRYNFDGYGERLDGTGWNDKAAGVGRLWPLLAGERGEYAVALGEDAAPYAKSMMGFASGTWMISEQVWDRRWPADAPWKFGKGTGSATPLAWSEAQFIRLVMAMKEKRIVEQPAVVREFFRR